jgi:hypothetical protein
MSRSGYHDDCDDYWALIRWRGAVTAAIRGRRGQAFFRDLIAALDAMPEKALVAGELQGTCGVCALGAVGVRRGIPMQEIDPYDMNAVAGTFGIANALAREVVYVNDEEGPRQESPERRWQRVRRWAETQLVGANP